MCVCAGRAGVGILDKILSPGCRILSWPEVSLSVAFSEHPAPGPQSNILDSGIPSAASHRAELPLLQCLCVAGAPQPPFTACDDSIQSCYNSTLSYAGKEFVGFS